MKKRKKPARKSNALQVARASVIATMRQYEAAKANALTWQRESAHWRQKYEETQAKLFATRDAFAAALEIVPVKKRAKVKATFEAKALERFP